MDGKELVNLAMKKLSDMNDGRRVVLHLNASMIHATIDGQHRYLPVMNIEGATGFYRFPNFVRDQVGDYFGGQIGAARELVAEINTEAGFTGEQALKVVIATMVRGRRQ